LIRESSAGLALNIKVLHSLYYLFEFFGFIDLDDGSIEWFVGVSSNLWVLTNLVFGKLLDLSGDLVASDLVFG
jgi:hypothetical protein